MMVYVSDIMTKNIITIDAEEGLCKAERIMSQESIGCLPVLDHGYLVGIITSRDIRSSHPNRIVADAMSSPVISVTSNTSFWKAKNKMERHKIERLLIIDDEKLVGLVTKKQLCTEIGKHIDLLTGLYKSSYIFHVGTELLEKKSEVSIIFFDLNKFGRIDKEHGHIYGDMILQEFGRLLKQHIPDDAYLCRFGGDEFVVLVPYKLEKCKALANGLLKVVSSNTFYENIDVTVSAGIAGGRRSKARRNSSEGTITDLINLASLASTKAKQEKLKVVIAEGTDISEIA